MIWTTKIMSFCSKSTLRVNPEGVKNLDSSKRTWHSTRSLPISSFASLRMTEKVDHWVGYTNTCCSFNSRGIGTQRFAQCNCLNIMLLQNVSKNQPAILGGLID